MHLRMIETPEAISFRKPFDRARIWGSLAPADK